MNRIVYVNGEYVPEPDAKVSVFDRGYLFADAVYEVTSILHGRLVDNAAHLARLQRSLREVGIEVPWSPQDIAAIQKTLIERNRIEEGLVYLQISRGVADRDFACPPGCQPGLVMFTQARPIVANPKAQRGLSVITVPDVRWRRRDIKTVGLLGAVMAMQKARQAGVDDAWLIEDGFVTEGSSSNAFIVTADSKVVTRHLSSDILPGITRAAVLRLCVEYRLELEERPFTPAEAAVASEAFITSATSFVLPVVNIDGQPVGAGKPGPTAQRLRELYIAQALEEVSG